MNRKKERLLIRILAAWQITDGLITIIYYGFYRSYILPNHGSKDMLVSPYGNIFLLVATFGILLIGLGIANLLIARCSLKDNQINVKIGVWLLAQTALSYLMMDIPGVVLSVCTAVILLAKNKTIKLNLQKI
ncbi:hypothetical protein EsVE80_22370 [Enterococcus saigonensis]|uniref:Uncharacterized protein n=1 Tax=Enterococcus saigonensis TaxID=1805431 RepID=A0A679IRH3_9ENTE|nr:hypothetical protein [Enterococcus saigonensis]BCA86714.1 hypothetical protein EsVE80_22370 [Enterococcus saigonensis]